MLTILRCWMTMRWLGTGLRCIRRLIRSSGASWWRTATCSSSISWRSSPETTRRKCFRLSEISSGKDEAQKCCRICLTESNLTSDKIILNGYELQQIYLTRPWKQVHSPTAPSGGVLSLQLPHRLHHVLCEDPERAGGGVDRIRDVLVVDGGPFRPRHWVERSKANTAKRTGTIDFYKTLFYAQWIENFIFA